MTKSQLENSQNFSQQFSDFKKEYINDLRLNLTSNVSDKIEPLIKEQLQLDIYSCKDFDIKDVFKFLEKNEFYNIKYKLINREKDLDNEYISF